MKSDNLTEKLSRIEVPEIEIQSHKAELRAALLSSRYFQKHSFSDVLRKCLIFTMPGLAVIAILGITVVSPKLSQAKVLNIAKNNPDIRKLMAEENMELGDLKIINGRAFVVLNSKIKENDDKENQSVNFQTTSISHLLRTEGAIVEVNIGKKEVVRINSINVSKFPPLNDKEKASAIQIINTGTSIESFVPKNAQIQEVASSLPKNIKLEQHNDEVEAIAEKENERRANVRYSFEDEEWIVGVNLDTQKVEDVRYFHRDKDDNDDARDGDRDDRQDD